MKQFCFEEPNFLGDRMRVIRLDHGLKQSEVAQALHVSRSTYSYYETGASRPDPLVLAKLANFYDLSINAFFSEEYPPQPCEPLSRDSVGILTPQERDLILHLREKKDLSVENLLEMLEGRIKAAAEENNP